MKTLRYFGVLLLAMCLASCEEQYVPGGADNENTWGVYFETAGVDYTMNDTSPASIEIKVLRSRTDGEVTVPLILTTDQNDVFSVPETVLFKDGEKEKTLTVTLDKIEFFKGYTAYIDLPVDPEYVYLYQHKDLATSVKVSVIKEDYVPYAEGTYTSGLFRADDGVNPYKTDITLEYSTMQKAYRLKSVYADGYDISFKWDKGVAATPAKEKFEVGITDPQYGMYYLSCKTISFDAATKTFKFPWALTVSEGTLAQAIDNTYQITSEI